MNHRASVDWVLTHNSEQNALEPGSVQPRGTGVCGGGALQPRHGGATAVPARPRPPRNSPGRTWQLLPPQAVRQTRAGAPLLPRRGLSARVRGKGWRCYPTRSPSAGRRIPGGQCPQPVGSESNDSYRPRGRLTKTVMKISKFLTAPPPQSRLTGPSRRDYPNQKAAFRGPESAGRPPRSRGALQGHGQLRAPPSGRGSDPPPGLCAPRALPRPRAASPAETRAATVEGTQWPRVRLEPTRDGRLTSRCRDDRGPRGPGSLPASCHLGQAAGGQEPGRSVCPEVDARGSEPDLWGGPDRRGRAPCGCALTPPCGLQLPTHVGTWRGGARTLPPSPASGLGPRRPRGCEAR